MWFLGGVELAIWIIMLGFELKKDSHRSKPVFMMDAGYYGNLVVLNMLILLKYHYYRKDEILTELLEEMITVVVHLMLLILAVKLAYESFPGSWLKKLFDEKIEEGSEEEDTND